MISNKWMIAICIIILGLYVQPILAQDGAKNLTVTVNTFTGEEGNKELKGNLIITENEGTDKKINISFTNLIEENSSQILNKSKINVFSSDLDKDQSKYTVTVKGYNVWVGEISINTTGIKSGTYDGKAIIEGTNFTPLDIGLSLKLAKPTWLKFVFLFLASIFIIFAVYLLDKGPTKYIVLVVIAVLAGLLLFMFPLFDAPENTLLSTSFFIPLAAYIVEYLTKRRDDRLALEKSVTEVKKKAVEDAVDFHSALLEEISAHAATFSCIDGVGANPLKDEVWTDGKKKAGMVSDLHGLILAQYYQYTDDFNMYLEARQGKKSLEYPFLFSWDKISGNDSAILKEFLERYCGIDWVKTANIELIGHNQIKVYIENTDNKILWLILNHEKNKVELINDERIDEFIVKNENDIYLGIDNFHSKFNQFNKAYKELVDILYYNLFYNIGSFQYKFHSFKEFEVPFRIPDELRHYLADITGKKMYLFNWYGIPGNDNERLITFLKQNYGIDWITEYLFTWEKVPGDDSKRFLEFLKQEFDICCVETEKIEKIDDMNKRVIAEKNYLSLGLNNEKTKVNLKIDDGRSAEFIAKSENGKLNIYKTVEIQCIDEKTIKVSNKNKYVKLKLNDDKNKVKLEINDVRTDFFIAKMETDKLKIYEIIINKDEKLYSEKVAEKLMKKIETEFNKKYENLQETLKELSKFKIQEQAAETSNAKKPSITVTYNEDTTPPSISITSPTNNQIFTISNVTVSGTASGNVALSKVEVKVGSGSYQMATGTASWSKSVTLASGCNTIYARVTDTSGNVKETSITVTYNKK
ncbi:MAG: Ig-like domain-containing protein [Candidatus Methanoperedens sp.]